MGFLFIGTHCIVQSNALHLTMPAYTCSTEVKGYLYSQTHWSGEFSQGGHLPGSAVTSYQHHTHTSKTPMHVYCMASICMSQGGIRLA